MDSKHGGRARYCFCLIDGTPINPLKTLLVIGTRPEAIKLAPVAKELYSASDTFSLKICSTGQHKEMLNQALKVFGLVPDFELEVMTNRQSLGDLTAVLMERFTDLLMNECFDLVIVQGDTTTALTCALSSFYNQIPIAHVEAGLRTGDIYSPFPEELNRQLLSRIATLHFAPTRANGRNLINEGISKKDVFVIGNTVVDALAAIEKQILLNKDLIDPVRRELERLVKFNLDSQKFVLVTVHRRENFGSRFEEICNAIEHLAYENKELHFIYPLHRNPNVANPANERLGNISNIKLIPPVDYISFLFLLKKCLFVMTDSGGVQEEAPSFRKKIVILREFTERSEVVTSGWGVIAGTKSDQIIKAASDLLCAESCAEPSKGSNNPFGDGNASKRIIKELERRFCLNG